MEINNVYQIKDLRLKELELQLVKDREDRRLEDAKDQELTARLRAVEEGYKAILSELADENKSAK